MLLSHTDLITFIRHIYPMVDINNGCCHGYSVMSARSIALGKREDFVQRMFTLAGYKNKLSELKKDICFAHVIQQKRRDLRQISVKLKNKQSLTLEEIDSLKYPFNEEKISAITAGKLDILDDYLKPSPKYQAIFDILAFFEGVLLNQWPKNFSYYHPNSDRAMLSAATTSIPQAQVAPFNVDFSQYSFAHEMRHYTQHTHLFSEQEFSAYLSEIQQFLTSRHPVLMIVPKHAVVIFFDPIKQRWYLDDINQLSEISGDHERLAQQCSLLCNDENFLAVSLLYLGIDEDPSLLKNLKDIDAKYQKNIDLPCRRSKSAHSLLDLLHQRFERKKYDSLLKTYIEILANTSVDEVDMSTHKAIARALRNEGHRFKERIYPLIWGKFCANEIQVVHRLLAANILDEHILDDFITNAQQTNITRLLSILKGLNTAMLLRVLMIAARIDAHYLFCQILTRNSHLNINELSYKKLPLLVALTIELAAEGKYNFFDVLLAIDGIDVNSMGDKKKTALYYAALHLDIELIERLVRAGGQVNMGHSPLSAALGLAGAKIKDKTLRQTAIVACLLKHGSNLSKLDRVRYSNIINHAMASILDDYLMAEKYTDIKHLITEHRGIDWSKVCAHLSLLPLAVNYGNLLFQDLVHLKDSGNDAVGLLSTLWPELINDDHCRSLFTIYVAREEDFLALLKLSEYHPKIKAAFLTHSFDCSIAFERNGNKIDVKQKFIRYETLLQKSKYFARVKLYIREAELANSLTPGSKLVRTSLQSLRTKIAADQICTASNIIAQWQQEQQSDSVRQTTLLTGFRLFHSRAVFDDPVVQTLCQTCNEDGNSLFHRFG